MSPAIPALQYQCSCPSGQTGRLQNILGLATPVKGFPKRNCPASERKPRSSAQKRLDRTLQRHGQMILRTKTFGSPNENTTYSRKEALTTTRPLLVNARPTGETCAKHFADTCYTASGPRAEITTLTDKAQHKRKVNEWATECATHIFPSKNRNSRTLKKKKSQKNEKLSKKKNEMFFLFFKKFKNKERTKKEKEVSKEYLPRRLKN